MSETLQIFGTTFSNINGLQARDINKDWLNYIIPSGSLSITQNGTFDCFDYLNAVAAIQTGVQIGAPLKVSSGTITPTSNSANIQVPFGDLTVASAAFIIVEKYTTYDVDYISKAPMYLSSGAVRKNPLYSGGGAAYSVILKTDGTITYTTNQNQTTWSYANGYFQFGPYSSTAGNSAWKAGVTYAYVVIGE